MQKESVALPKSTLSVRHLKYLSFVTEARIRNHRNGGCIIACIYSENVHSDFETAFTMPFINAGASSPS